MRQLTRAGILFALLATGPAALPQQPATQQNGNQNTQSLGDIARKQRELKEQQARTAGNDSTTGSQGQKSLADVAREQQEKSLQEVRTSLQDSQKLFASINETLDFASKESGFAKHNAVKHQLIGEAEVKRQMTQNLSNNQETQRLTRSELVLKKFGFLPPNFDLKTFLLSASPRGLGAYYDPRTKMVNLLNWIEISEQLPILSHELTHALQDQNYDLLRWRGYNPDQPLPPAKMRVESEDEEESSARTAVVEGQAQIVYYDYLLKPYDKSLLDTPEFLDILQAAVNRTYDNTVVVHNEPLLLKESGLFPYREGLSFELELLRTGGKPMAFAGAFARPPRDTHDVLEPEAYISNRKSPPSLMPDLTALLSDKYEAYDSGVVGELEVRTMAKQFGREDDGLTLAPNWDGGAYVAVKRITATANKTLQLANDKPAPAAATDQPTSIVVNKSVQAASDKPIPVSADKLVAANDKPTSVSADKAVAAGGKPAPSAAEKPVPISTHDLALLYVSRWKTLDAAQRFLQLYQSSLPKRVTVLDTKTAEPPNCSNDSSSCGPLWSVRVTTDDGPIYLEIWPKNLVIIAQSFDETTVNRLRQAVLLHVPNNKAKSSTAELSMKLFELPEFQAYQEEIGRQIYSSFSQQLLKSSYLNSK